MASCGWRLMPVGRGTWALALVEEEGGASGVVNEPLYALLGARSEPHGLLAMPVGSHASWTLAGIPLEYPEWLEARLLGLSI